MALSNDKKITSLYWLIITQYMKTSKYSVNAQIVLLSNRNFYFRDLGLEGQTWFPILGPIFLGCFYPSVEWDAINCIYLANPGVNQSLIRVPHLQLSNICQYELRALQFLLSSSTDPKHWEKVIRVMQVMTAGADRQLCKRDQTATESCLISDPHEDAGVHICITNTLIWHGNHDFIMVISTFLHQLEEYCRNTHFIHLF